MVVPTINQSSGVQDGAAATMHSKQSHDTGAHGVALEQRLIMTVSVHSCRMVLWWGHGRRRRMHGSRHDPAAIMW